MTSPVLISTHTAIPPKRDQPPLVLVVGDDPTTRTSIAVELTGGGFRVVEAADSDEAVARSQQEPPAAVIADYHLPHSTGVQLAAALNAIRHVPIIVLSGMADSRNVLEAIEAGVFLYLIKPLDPSRLVPLVRAALKRSVVERPAHDSRASKDPLAEKAVRCVGIATGLLMARYGLSSTDAYHRLRRYARRQRLSIPEVATAVLESSDRASRLFSAIASVPPGRADGTGRTEPPILQKS